VLNFFILFFGVLLGVNTWVPVISQIFGYWLHQVTEIQAIPARILRIFFSTKPARKKDLSSIISLGLKTAVLAETSNQNSGRPGQNS
jgi:hypothetical protein